MTREKDTWKGWWEKFGSWWDSFDRSGQQEPGSNGNAGSEGRDQRSNRLRNLVLLALLGAGMMVLSQRAVEEPVSTPSAAAVDSALVPAVSDHVHTTDALERKVAMLLSQIAGVGRVEVLIVPKTSDVNVYAEEVTTRKTVTQTPADGRSTTTMSREESETRRPIIVNSGGSSSQEPVVEYVRKAEVAGVLVVADGAHDAETRLQLLRAVSAVLDLPPHRIEIVPRKQ